MSYPGVGRGLWTGGSSGRKACELLPSDAELVKLITISCRFIQSLEKAFRSKKFLRKANRVEHPIRRCDTKQDRVDG